MRSVGPVSQRSVRTSHDDIVLGGRGGEPETSSQGVRDMLSCFEGRADRTWACEDKAWVPKLSRDAHWLLTVSGPVQVVLELARLYLLQGHLDLCEQHCADLLQTEKNHEAASVVRGCGPVAPRPQGGLLGRGAAADSALDPSPRTGGVGWQQGAAATSLLGHIQGERVRLIHSRGNHTRW